MSKTRRPHHRQSFQSSAFRRAHMPPASGGHVGCTPFANPAPIFGPEQWGQPIIPRGYEALVAVPQHVTLDLQAVPEGALCVARCVACGGRFEALLDWRSWRGLSSQGAFDRCVAQGASHALAPLQGTWLPQHRDCPTRPLTHALAADVQRLVDDALAQARHCLRAGELVPALLQLRLADGGLSRIPLDHIPPTHPHDGGFARSTALHLLGLAVRDGVRVVGVPATAAVTVAEGWYVAPAEQGLAGSPRGRDDANGTDCVDATAYPAFNSRRREGLVVGVTTRAFALIGFADIVRDGGVIDEGPGRTGPITLEPMRTPSALLDGLLAVSRTPGQAH